MHLPIGSKRGLRLPLGMNDTACLDGPPLRPCWQVIPGQLGHNCHLIVWFNEQHEAHIAGGRRRHTTGDDASLLAFVSILDPGRHIVVVALAFTA
jgi:hypothetical protein